MVRIDSDPRFDGRYRLMNMLPASCRLPTKIVACSTLVSDASPSSWCGRKGLQSDRYGQRLERCHCLNCIVPILNVWICLSSGVVMRLRGAVEQRNRCERLVADGPTGGQEIYKYEEGYLDAWQTWALHGVAFNIIQPYFCLMYNNLPWLMFNTRRKVQNRLHLADGCKRLNLVKPG